MSEKKLETNKEIRNDELKTAMITLKLQQDEETEKDFIDLLRKAYFLIPAEKSGKKDELSLVLLKDQESNNYFQAYTDLDEYNKWFDHEDSQYFVLTFDEYANIVVSSEDEVKGLVINPFSENIIINKDKLNELFHMDKVFIDELKECPTKIKNTFKKVLKEETKVNSAYLMQITKNNIPGYLLIIETNARDKKKLFDSIGYEILKHVEQINIDIISSKDEVGKNVIKDKKPFYTKKKI